MSNPKFTKTYKLVTFLEKLEESDWFKEIIDFLNASYVQYALTVNPTIYTSRLYKDRDLKLADAEGIDCLPTAIIFAELERTGPGMKFSEHYGIAISLIIDEESCITYPFPKILPLSGEDSMQLSELMNLCTNLQEKVLDLEKAKTAQAKEIASLKKRVNQLEKRRKLRTPGLKRLRKVV
ncbi:hypothetical protein Tco_0953208 [Tanacetum coccineum]|uniref:Uncharacterized protein n=1 Tax=Tanacetum coccineum TaxID=301880 RepID=A0ABQ5E126_9ASTR